MVARLRTHVHVLGKDGQMHVFGPDDVLPAWARKQITNPNAWEPQTKSGGSHVGEEDDDG